MIYAFFDQKNTPYFVFGFGILILAICIYLIVRLFLLEKSIAHGKVKLIARIEIDPDSMEGSIKLNVVNRSFNNVDIRGFGFKHYNHDYDFMKEYREAHELRDNEKIIIGARETLESTIDLTMMEAKLNSKNIKKFRVYAIDVYGNYIIKRAKYVEKYIESIFKKAEFVEKVNNMPKEKQLKYYAKEIKLDNRAKSILNKSIALKLNNDDLADSHNISVEEKIEDLVNAENKEVATPEEVIDVIDTTGGIEDTLEVENPIEEVTDEIASIKNEEAIEEVIDENQDVVEEVLETEETEENNSIDTTTEDDENKTEE